VGLKVAVASGKGGTGKTTIATCLAVLLHRAGARAWYVDCDVEEPNGHIFLKPTIRSRETVGLPVPRVDEDKCVACGRCAQICQFNAIVLLGKRVMVFEELCHGCGGCWLVCPEGAIEERQRELGVVEQGSSDGLGFVQGRLRIAEALSPPLIRAVKRRISEDGIVIADAPPGTSCPVVETIRGSRLVLLVAEPTPFGLSDLEAAVEMVRQIGVEFMVLINRCDVGDEQVKLFCQQKRIEIIAQIPDDRAVAVCYSHGQLPIDAVPGYADLLKPLVDRVLKEYHR